MHNMKIPEYLIEAGASQQNRIEPPAVPDQPRDQQLHIVEENQIQILNSEESRNQPVQPIQEVSRITPEYNTNRSTNVTDAECYKMDNKNRGLCLIFTHDSFNENTRLKNRDAAVEEADMIKNTFKKLGYRVAVCRNYKFEWIDRRLKKLGNLVYPDDDCISICVSTHGFANLLWSYDCLYPIDLLENALAKMEKLSGKPKKIFIQACRGKKIDRGISFNHTDSQSEDEIDNSVYSKKHPSRADFLIVQSTPYGYVSWRKLFFKSLCPTLDRFSEEDDIDEILRKTARKMCEYESRCKKDASRDRAKQVPAIYSTLLKKLYLKRK